MSNAVYPSGIRGLAYTVTKTAEFSTDLQSSSSKNEVRVPLVNGLTDPPPTLSYNILGPGFVINGVTYGLVFSWGWQPGSPYPTGSIIIDPAGHLQLQTAPFGYSSGFLPAFSDSGGSVTDNALIWTDQGLATTIFGSFSFYYRVRFATDRQDFEQFTKDFWTIGGSQGKNSSQLTLVTSRPHVTEIEPSYIPPP